MGIRRQVQVVSPSAGFKHLGIYQDGDDVWEAIVSHVWQHISEEVERIQCQRLTRHQFRYVVNSVLGTTTSLSDDSWRLFGPYFAGHTHYRDPSTMIRSRDLGYLAVNWTQTYIRIKRHYES
ncbi:hypothetical protein PHMEG_00025253 [Phytophthora megakarya]|uniref:Uncharacterized protein n=1 Tax=Phytophthora megakarya TaxID=4795 RepID=A0A225VDQ0_9STRA|nr:hypothetical protein PHMEG_00025253 [Phytophthora megakarya]